MNVKLSFASDHAGFEVKEKLISIFNNKYYSINRGTTSAEQVDYPDYALRVVDDIISHYANFGILICGTGIGMSIMANRFSQIRACNPITIKQAILARQHNDANVICFGARLSSLTDIQEMLETFIHTKFEGGRHLDRVKKLCINSKNLMSRFAEEF